MVFTFIPVTTPSIFNSKHPHLLKLETWPLISQPSVLLSVPLLFNKLFYIPYIRYCEEYQRRQ